jgi:hypothetical protein
MVRGKGTLISKRALIIVLVALFFLPSLSAVAQGEIRLPHPVPLFNQAYKDASGYWGDCRMGSDGCPDRIATAGCLITAFAMVLDYYGVELSIPAASSCTGKRQRGMDPGILNDWLRTHGGYGRCGEDLVGKCCLEWTHLPPQISITTYTNQRNNGIDSTSRQRIDQALERGYPVISGVHWGSHCHGTTTQSEDCHWVVITGKSGSTYTIVDPYNRDSSDPHGVETTLDYGVFGVYTIDRFVVVSGPVPSYPLQDLQLELSFAPKKGVFLPGDAQTRFITLRGSEGREKLLLYVRVIDPTGKIHYAYYETSTPQAGDPLFYSQERHSLYPVPQGFSDGTLAWNETTLSNAEEGTWTWEVWLEDPSRPGIPLGYDIAAYTIATRLSPPDNTLAVSLALVLTLLVTTVIYALTLAQNKP